MCKPSLCKKKKKKRGVNLLACGLGTVRTGLDVFQPMKLGKENTNNPRSIVVLCVISKAPVRWGIPWHYTVILWHKSMMNNARLRNVCPSQNIKSSKSSPVQEENNWLFA